MLTKLELVKEFIDYVYNEYKKELYMLRRQEPYSILPADIMIDPYWVNRNNYFFDFSNSVYIDYDNDLYYLIDDFEPSSWCEENYSIEGGSNQVAFIFNNEVIKVSKINMPKKINNFKEKMGEYGNFIAETIFLQKYRSLIIYSQPKVNLAPQDLEQIIYYNLRGVIDDDNLIEYIEKELDYNKDRVNKLKNLLLNSRENIDLHCGNWGLLNDKVCIFDPIFVSKGD